MVYSKATAAPRWKAADVKEFCGWDFLQRMIDQAELGRGKLLIAAAFLTGGRITEVLRLEPHHFDFKMDPNMVVVKAMPIVKRYEKIKVIKKWKCVVHCKMRWGTRQRPREPTPEERAKHDIVEYNGWETKLNDEQRLFPFPKTEPLVPILQNLIDAENGKLFDFKYNTAYNEITSIGEMLGTKTTPHWLRVQRASQLALEYGFREHELVEWFLWKDYATAFTYARKGYKGLAAKMVRPT